MIECSTYESRLDQAVAEYHRNRKWVMERKRKEQETIGLQLVKQLRMRKVEAAA